VWRRADRTRGTSDHMRSDASGRGGSSLDSDRTPGAARSVVAWSASGRCVACAGAMRSARPVDWAAHPVDCV
jgi:hypothetical protein